MPVPLIDLTRNQAQLAEIEAAVVRVVRSGQYILGPEVENLEKELADYLGCRHALTMSSGTDAFGSKRCSNLGTRYQMGC